PSDSIRTAVLSASVINTDKLKDHSKITPNILSSLLLSTDIKGYIENPGYYFDGKIKIDDIDNLLLTQGWRKINITPFFEVKEPIFSPEKAYPLKDRPENLEEKRQFPMPSWC